MRMRRRTFIGSALASSLAAFGVGNAQSGKPHIAVIGAGAFGGWTIGQAASPVAFRGAGDIARCLGAGSLPLKFWR